MTMNRHEPFEELISASLNGDLTADERRRLDAHLDGCPQCRDTLAAFSDQRRIIAGLRHVAPPRDLGARVRAGVESASVPWWRKPTTIFTAVGGTLAAVTGALLALVVLNGTPSSQPVGQASPTPSFESAPTAVRARSRPPSRRQRQSPTLPPAATPTPPEATPARPDPDRRLTGAGPLPRLRPRDAVRRRAVADRGRGPDGRCRPGPEPPRPIPPPRGRARRGRAVVGREWLALSAARDSPEWTRCWSPT